MPRAESAGSSSSSTVSMYCSGKAACAPSSSMMSWTSSPSPHLPINGDGKQRETTKAAQGSELVLNSFDLLFHVLHLSSGINACLLQSEGVQLQFANSRTRESIQSCSRVFPNAPIYPIVRKGESDWETD